MATKTDSRMEEVMEISSETEGSSYSASDSDSDAAETDPDYDILEETYGKLSNLSIDKKAKSRVVQGENRRVESDTSPEELEMSDSGLDEKDEEKFEKVQKMIDAGELEKLKVLECKLYLRKSGLRLTGKKDMLIQRIREHLEIINGGGERKYPHSSFVLNCKGDACTGDVVLFEQNVYEMFSIASRSATGPPCGKRTVAGRIVKESYGAAKQQHTFTIEVLWSKGEKPLPPLHPLLIKGRNLYRLKTLRQRWEDEGKRQKILMEKHSRGDVARANREVRIQEKEKRKINRENRVSKNEPSRNHSQSHPVMTKSKYQHEGSAISIDEAKPKSFFDHGENVTTKPHQQRIYHMPIDEAKPKSFFDHGENVTTKPHQQRIYHMPNHHALKRSENGWILSDIHHHHTRGSEYSEKNYSHDTIHSREKRIITETNRSANCRIPYENYYYHARDVEFNEKYYYHSRDAEYSEKYYYHNNHSIEARITTETNRYPERHELLRKPLTSANHLFPPLTLNREPQKHKKLCRYYAQGPGRCHYGDNCKFLHDFREHR